MTDPEQDRFEDELRRSRPARPPEEMWSRLLAAGPRERFAPGLLLPALAACGWRRVFRFLIPAAGVALAALIIWRSSLDTRTSKRAVSNSQPKDASEPGLKADHVEIAQELLSSFDTLARLPGGEPVRFRCREWLDQVTLSDKTQGVVLQERTPRVEVVAVGFETY